MSVISFSFKIVFTFQYVSILIKKIVAEIKSFIQFTFQYVSILIRSGRACMLPDFINLHSNMFLF